MVTADEEVAGTSATNAADRFAAALSTGSRALVLSWPSVAGRDYTVETSPTLLPPDWRPLAGCAGIPGTGEPLSIALPALSTSKFFRILVHLP